VIANVLQYEGGARWNRTYHACVLFSQLVAILDDIML